MGQVLKVIAGFDGGPWAGSLKNQGIPVAYDPADTFTATVSRGGDEGSLFTPAVSWIDATVGTFRFSTSAAQTAALEPGLYILQIGVVAQGIRREAFDGFLEVLPTVGTSPARVPYVRLSDLQRYYDQIAILQDRLNDSTGFLMVRVDVSDELDRAIVERYNPRPGFVKVRQNTLDPIVGLDVPSGSAVPPSKRAVTVALAAGGLIVERKAREIVARRAIADVLDRQEVTGRNGYREEAAAMRLEADRLWRTYQAQLDLTSPPDGVPDVLLDMDCTLLPTGTSP